ncbi:MAG: hypothetical protein GXY83_09110 [Rhodopirellula sp.]|nr:hypothetical protein [Rhodopirellula sp.]
MHEINPACQSGTVAMDVDDRIEQFRLWSVFHKHLIVEWFALLRDEFGGDYWVDMESEVLLIPRPPGPAVA